MEIFVKELQNRLTLVDTGQFDYNGYLPLFTAAIKLNGLTPGEIVYNTGNLLNNFTNFIFALMLYKDITQPFPAVGLHSSPEST